MARALRWPLFVVALLGGVAIGRYVEMSPAQGQAVPAVAIPAELTSYRDVVKRVLPAVVSIDSKIKPKKADPQAQQRPRQPKRELPPGIPEELRRFFEAMPEDGQGPPDGNLGFGSGFLVDPQGVILTNYHVIDGADEVEITLTDGRKFTSNNIKGDQRTDLAIIRIKADGPLPFLSFGDSSAMEIGDRVLAVGAPFGLTGSVTHGIISAKGRDLRLNRYDDFLQTDAAINPGNSGGPLVDLAGRVIGINSAIKSRSGGFQGVGLAISSNLARSVMQQLLTNGSVKRGYLGIESVRDLTPDVAARYGLKNGAGVLIARVFPNTPSAKSGLKPDDAIVAIGGKTVRDIRELQRVVGGLPLNQPVQLDVIRDGKPQTLSLTIEEEPDGYGNRPVPPLQVPRDAITVTAPRAGLELTDLADEQAEALGLSQKGGAIIMRSDPRGPAAEVGVGRGQVIFKVDKRSVNSAEAAKEALEKADPEKGALVHLVSPRGGTAVVIVKVGKN